MDLDALVAARRAEWDRLDALSRTRRLTSDDVDELVARYEERTGRSASDLRWYQALALWKSAVFLEGNYKRYMQGASDDEFYRLMERGIPELAQAALEVTRQPPPRT